MADEAHTAGEMNISQQVQTYRGFLAGSKWGSLAVGVGVFFFTLWFCAGLGFFGAIIPTVIALAGGVFVIKQFFSEHGHG